MDERWEIAAVIAAAGFSRRMGAFKQLLPWDGRTVIESVVAHLHAAGASPVIAVVGHRGDEVAVALADMPAVVVRNPDYAEAEMLSSYQAGVRVLQKGKRQKAKSKKTIQMNAHHLPPAPCPLPLAGTLLALGDQPHIPAGVIRCILEQARRTPDRIVIPSYERRRGHPIYLPRRLWDQLLGLSNDQTLRDLLNRYEDEIVYVNVETDAIRRDMDEWEEYETLRKERGT